MNRAHAHREAWVHEDPWAGLRYSEATQASFLEANHTRGALDAQVFIGMNAWYLGAAERAERELRATLAIGEDLGLVSSLRPCFSSRCYVSAGSWMRRSGRRGRWPSDPGDGSGARARAVGAWARCYIGAVPMPRPSSS